MAAGGAVRFARLAYPNAYVFDEVYYAKDACMYLGHPGSYCGVGQASEQSWVHPPLGKWIIAVGEKIFGYNSFGWRFMPAVFGTLLIGLVYLIGRRLFGRWGGAVAALLAASDFLLIVQSRTSMLDIFLTFFVALGFYFVVLERERVLKMRAAGRGKLQIRWRLAAGAAFGAAGSVKWSGFYAMAAAMALVVFWTVAAAVRIKRSQEPDSPRRAPGALTELNFSLTAMAFPALAVYLLSYVSFFVERSPVIGLGTHKRFSLSAFASLQSQMLSYHLHLTTKHTYASPAWKWPILFRPVAYYFTGGVRDRHILAFGNPATWWLALAAGLWFLYKALVRRDVPSLAVMTLWLAQYLPWALFSRPQFFFYMAPIVPFMTLAVTGTILDIVRGYRSENVLMGSITVLAVLGLVGGLLWFHSFNLGPSLDQQRRIVEVAGIPILALGLAAVLGIAPKAAPLRKILAGAYLGIACVLALVYFYPVIAAWAIPVAQWQHRMLFPTWI